MTTTYGQLIATLFERFERKYGDQQRAAVATHRYLADLLFWSVRARHAAR